jgi:hypothetical protein
LTPLNATRRAGGLAAQDARTRDQRRAEPQLASAGLDDALELAQSKFDLTPSVMARRERERVREKHEVAAKQLENLEAERESAKRAGWEQEIEQARERQKAINAEAEPIIDRIKAGLIAAHGAVDDLTRLRIEYRGLEVKRHGLEGALANERRSPLIVWSAGPTAPTDLKSWSEDLARDMARVCEGHMT